MPNQPKRLVRSRTDRILAGVCGGIAQYFGFDPTIVRVVFAVLVVIWGSGILLYIALWIIMPLEGKEEAQPNLADRVKTATHELKTTAKQVAKEFKGKKK